MLNKPAHNALLQCKLHLVKVFEHTAELGDMLPNQVTKEWYTIAEYDGTNLRHHALPSHSLLIDNEYNSYEYIRPFDATPAKYHVVKNTIANQYDVATLVGDEYWINWDTTGYKMHELNEIGYEYVSTLIV